MRNIKFSVGEFYHIYNRGVDKREVFMDKDDLSRFIFCMSLFNKEEPVGSIYLNSLQNKRHLRSSASHKVSENKKLVNFVAYCLNQNHYHFILEPLTEDGVQKFMHRLSTGYTNYFNDKYKRSGSLFQGRYKAVHVDSNTYLVHLSAYVNLNYKVHKNLNKEWMNNLSISSFKEYCNPKINSFCEKSIVLDQFKNSKDYISFCLNTLPEILRKKESEKELKNMLIEV